MRVITVTEFGGPEVLRLSETDDPTAGDGQLVIDVDVVEIIHLDTQLRAGWGRDFFAMRPPWVPGTGVAGTVVAVGPGVDPARVGENFVARTGNEGGYAECVAVRAGDAYAIPDGLDPALATAALHDGVLALSQWDHVRVGAGSRVLVTAAAGALGFWFVPLARRAGAEVIGAAGGARKVAAVAENGADRAVDYSRADWAAGLAPVDVVFDGVGGAIGRTAAGLLRSGGVFGGYGAASGDFASVSERDDIVVRGIDQQLPDEQWDRLTREALRLLADGVVRPVIGQRVDFADVAKAHEAIAARAVIGKSVLVV